MVTGRDRPRGRAWERAADAVPYEEFDPLDRVNLGRSVETALVSRPLIAFNMLSPFWGSGIYPIYFGRARPEGSRKGSAEILVGHRSKALSDRLYHHRKSIDQAKNLATEDF